MPFPASLTETLKHYRLQPFPSVTGLPQPVTTVSVAHFLWALAWVCILLIAFVGWGRATGKILRSPALPFSVACSVGIAAIIFLGGLLNLSGLIYSPVLVGMVAIGVLFYLITYKVRFNPYQWLSRWKASSRLTKLVLAIAFLILALRVAATVRLGTFRVEDDGTAYLVYPQKMLATHRFASDPFSDRRIISSLGGAYLLQSFVLTPTSLPHLGMADRTLGLLLLFISLFDLGIGFGLSPPQIAWMELIVYLVPQPTFNLSFQILPIALFLSMVWLVLATVEPPALRWRAAALLGMIGGAVICLKSTYLPFACTLALLPFLWVSMRRRRTELLTYPLIAGVSALLVLAAWMIAMKMASGTYLFPVLGHGFDYSSYGLFREMPKFISSSAWIRVFLQGAILLLLAFIPCLTGSNSRTSQLGISVLIAAVVAIIAFNYKSGGDYIWRYNFPQFFTAIIVLFASQAAEHNRNPNSGRSTATYALSIAALVCCVFYYDLEGGRFQPFRQSKAEIQALHRDLRASISGMQLVDAATRKKFLAIETAIPPGATVLDLTTNAFLLKANDNRKFLLDDWPGAASPPPGWPFTKNPLAVANFLSQNSVRYVVYDYKFAHWFDMQSCQSLTGNEHLTKLNHALEILEMLTHRQFDALHDEHPSIYDNGTTAVIDLQSPVSHPAATGPAWTLSTSETEMCSEIVRRYAAEHPLPESARLTQ